MLFGLFIDVPGEAEFVCVRVCVFFQQTNVSVLALIAPCLLASLDIKKFAWNESERASERARDISMY